MRSGESVAGCSRIGDGDSHFPYDHDRVDADHAEGVVENDPDIADGTWRSQSSSGEMSERMSITAWRISSFVMGLLHSVGLLMLAWELASGLEFVFISRSW